MYNIIPLYNAANKFIYYYHEIERNDIMLYDVEHHRSEGENYYTYNYNIMFTA